MIDQFTYLQHPAVTALFGLCIGSFLHALSHRIAYEKPILRKRSHCPSCDGMIPWYYNIPVFAWFWLSGRCASCKASISWTYPFIELATAICLVFVWHYMPLTNIMAKIIYSLFASALIVATTTDLHTMTIPQVVSLWFAPIGLIAAYANQLLINLEQSLIGCFLGYASLWAVNQIFKKIKKIDGMGVGDMELFCMIGAFIGPYGLWHTLLVASVTGSLVGLAIQCFYKKQMMIPFGPFLALGALCHLAFQFHIERLLRMGMGA